MTDLEIELLALKEFKNAPDVGLFPNYTDRDIWVNGFCSGVKNFLNNKTYVKQLDVQWGTPKMPEDVKEFFFDYFDEARNDTWVEYIVDDDEPNILDVWLKENINAKPGETILLKHWW